MNNRISVFKEDIFMVVERSHFQVRNSSHGEILSLVIPLGKCRNITESRCE